MQENKKKATRLERKKCKYHYLQMTFMILYVENHKESTKIAFEQINQSGNVAGYKINAQKVFFLYTISE
jgi:hypothetical protein